MSETSGSQTDCIPLDQIEERELRRTLLLQSRAGDAAAQAKLFELYGVKVWSPSEATEAGLHNSR